MDNDKKLLMRGINELRASLGLNPYDSGRLETMDIEELKKVYKTHYLLKPHTAPAAEPAKQQQPKAGPVRQILGKPAFKRNNLLIMAAAFVLIAVAGLYVFYEQDNISEKSADKIMQESGESISIEYAYRNGQPVYVFRNEKGMIRTLSATADGVETNYSRLVGALPAGPNESVAIILNGYYCGNKSKIEFLINGLRKTADSSSC